MPETILKKEPVQEARVDAHPKTGPAKNFGGILPFFGVVLVSSAVALAYHFVCGHAKTTLLYDARGYLWSAGRISEFLVNAMHQKWTVSLVTDKEFLSAILRDGPVFPTFFAVIFAI
ncbi:MAG: hypothetical protein K2Z81_15195, partial [Cyanobacteria bacterium]|nr:hypothetical protein [Cyanobacteriota bacterium]